ncbi:MAG: aldose 1-epimerase [Acidovorax sp.]
MQVVELNAGALRLALRPDLGGSVAGLWHGSVPVLRSTEPAALTGPRTSASFPLLPYSNRLGFRRFRWQGNEYTTAPNFDDSPHSLHGVGWLRAWQVEGHDGHSVALNYRHKPDAHWPFAFDAYQRIALEEGRLVMRLTLVNTDAREQPVGLGWHPYFPRRQHSRLRMALESRWESDARQLPTHAVPLPGIDAPVAALHYDHCFAGWNGMAVIEDECFELRLGSTLRHAVVFTPPGRDFFCVEPVGHANDAIHLDDPSAHGLIALAPGATTEAEMTLQIKAR